jgi:hypothetical protein
MLASRNLCLEHLIDVGRYDNFLLVHSNGFWVIIPNCEGKDTKNI